MRWLNCKLAFYALNCKHSEAQTNRFTATPARWDIPKKLGRYPASTRREQRLEAEMQQLSLEHLFASNSEIATLMRSYFADANADVNTEFINADLSGLKTLGAVETWPFNLKNAFNILFSACCPMFLVWESQPSQRRPDKRILFYNDAYLCFLKSTRRLIPFGQFVSNAWAADWQDVRADVDQVFATGQSFQRQKERFLIYQDDSYSEHFYTWSYNAIWNEAGQISGIFATGCKAEETVVTYSRNEHSTEQKSQSPQEIYSTVRTISSKHERELSKSRVEYSENEYARTSLTETTLQQREDWQQREKELQLLTNALPVLIAYVDKNHYYRFNNQTYEDWFGQPAATFTGKHICEVLGEDAYVAVRPCMEKALSGQRVSFESQIPYREGGTRYIKADYIPHINSQGEVEGYFSLVSDISESKQVEAERQQAEENLRLSENRYRTLANAVAQLMWMNDANGNIQFFNQQWEIYTGVANLKLGVGLWAEIIHPEDFQPTSAARMKAIQAGEAYEVECRLKRVDQTYRWHLARVVPFKNEQGEILYWFGTATDIDARKCAEAARERLLAQEQAAREAAEQANRIKDEFLAVLSHELRSPLNPILGWAKLLQTRHFGEAETKRALETIERNAKLQTQLIDDLLDVSRILRGKMALNVTLVNLGDVIDAALETVRLSFEVKNIEIRKAVVGEIGLISGDAGRLQQIVWNLLSNSIKFTSSGGQIEICLEQIGSHVQIQVKDTGKGISPEFLPHVFDYFRQEDGTTTRKFGGLGLGLAIVRYLTELHGGTVKAESLGEGLGATFTVGLPVARETESGLKQDGSINSVAEIPLTNLRVLVVDDEVDMRELVVAILQQSGAKVKATASAIEALEAFNSFNPDVLISDIGMPEIDGYALLDQIRSLPKNKPLPAIALTAYAGEANQQRALAAGFQRHIAKPIEPEELVKAIMTLTKLQY